jgi:hypothetical protein
MQAGCGARTLACRVHTRVNASLRDWRTIGKANISPLKCSLIKKLSGIAHSCVPCWQSCQHRKRSHECERGTQECVRHTSLTAAHGIDKRSRTNIY